MKWISGVTLALALAGSAHGQLTYSAKSRSVSASTGGGTQSFSTSAIGYWSQGASSSDTLGGAGAHQTSDLRPDGISFSSGTGASNQNGAFATCDSALDVTFSLGATTPFEFTRSTQDYLQNASVQLTQGTTTIFSFFWGLNDGNFPFSYEGALAPGVYRLRTSLSSTANATVPDYYFNCQENFILNIPAPGATAAILVGLSIASARRRR